MDAFWIILTGTLVAASGGLLGSFLILRKMTMVGDAISHAVLPGIVIAYLFTQSIATPFMLAGAAIFGLLTTVFIEWLHKQGKLQMDAAIGVSFTWLFAIGIILITALADKIDLDQDCVLYGEIAYVPLDIWVTDSGLDMGPISVWTLGGNFILVLLFIIFGYKGLAISSFDAGFAQTRGFSISFWHFGLMGMVSLTTVFAFEAVGVILVVAFLTGPAASAYLLTNKLKNMLIISIFIGLVSSIGGYWMASVFNASVSAAMAVCIGIVFVISFIIYRLRLRTAPMTQ